MSSAHDQVAPAAAPFGGRGWPAAAILESAPLAVLVFDREGTVRSCNPAAEQLLGAPAGDVVGRPVRELFPADIADGTLRRIDAAARGELGHLEVDLARPDGGSVEVGISFAVLEHDGVEVGTVGVGRGIHDRKRLEHELRALASSYQALAEGSDLGMYRLRVDPGGEVSFEHANTALLEAVGVTFEELTRDPGALLRRLPPDVADRLRLHWFDADTAPASGDEGDGSAASAAQADPGPVEFDWVAADGQRLTVSVLQVPVRRGDGTLEALLGLVRDVTRQRRQEAALEEALALEREAADGLRRVDELRRLFLQAVSHELRTPLTGVLGFSGMLRDRADRFDDTQVVEVAGRIVEQGTRMQRLLDDLLDIERLSRGVVGLERRHLDVGGLVEAVATEHGDPGVEIDIQPVAALVDAMKVERIVVNLLANARRHGGADARIRLRVRPVDGHVSIEVDDDGPGLPKELRARVFEPFEQGPAAAGSHAPGTGIGLTLVAEFARLHGGRAAVGDSDLGGARFTVELPV